MPIMLGGGSSENLSRCYLGDQLLVGGECAKPYSISTDLRGKTAQQIVDEGWEGLYSKTNSGYTLDSNGLANGQSWNMSAWILYELPQLSTNSIIKFYLQGTQSGSGYYSGGFRFGLIDTKAVDGLTQGNYNEYYHAIRWVTDGGGIDASNKSQYYISPGSSSGSWNEISSQGTYGYGRINCEGEINFKELTMSIVITGAFSANHSGNITTTVRDTMIQQCKYAYYDATSFGSSGKNYIEIVGLDITV